MSVLLQSKNFMQFYWLDQDKTLWHLFKVTEDAFHKIIAPMGPPLHNQGLNVALSKRKNSLMHGNLTLERNGHFSLAPKAKFRPWLWRVDTMVAMILCTLPSVTWNKCHRGPIFIKSVKMHGNLTLEHNGHFSHALRATFCPWLWRVGPMGAIVLCTAPSITYDWA